MKKVIGVAVIAVGVLALLYGGFTYASITHEANLGPVLIELEDKQRLIYPIWLGAGAIVSGVILLIFGRLFKRESKDPLKN